MPCPEATQRAVAIAVHDVAPATWRECRELLAMLDDAGASPLTLLVVPHYHYRSVVLQEPAFLRAMEARLARGDELALHGYFHLDDGGPARTPREWIDRRVLTRREGEFAALAEDAAMWRLARGIAMFDRLGWPLAGFVPPAWLASQGTRAALARCHHRFAYVTVRSGIFHLPDWRFEPTANLCYSPDSALRRAISRCAIAHALSRARGVPLLRMSLHPQDARVRRVLDHWRRLVVDALAGRPPVTKREWVRVRASQWEPRAAEAPFGLAPQDARVSPARATS